VEICTIWKCFCITLVLFIQTAAPWQDNVVRAQTAQDYSPFRQWIGKDPFVAIGGKKLFDTKLFQVEFKKTVGQRIYDNFMDGYKHDKYFQSSSIVENSGVMSIYVQDLSLDFYTTIYVHLDTKSMDVCWNESSTHGNEPAVNAILYHDGKQTPVGPQECQDRPYGKSENTNKESINTTQNTKNTSQSDQYKKSSSSSIKLSPNDNHYMTTGRFTAPGPGLQNYTVIKIDTKSFPKGGKLKLLIDIGNGNSAASIDLFPEGVPIPTKGRPTGSLGGVYDIAAGRKNIEMIVTSGTGHIYNLGITGNWKSPAGSTNDFTLKATVIP